MTAVKLDPAVPKMEGWPVWDDVLRVYAATAFAVDTRLGELWCALVAGEWPADLAVELDRQLFNAAMEVATGPALVAMQETLLCAIGDDLPG